MKGGRLKIVNVSSYPTDEVEWLVKYGLSKIDLTGERCVVVVKNTRKTARRRKPPAYSGVAYSLDRGGIPTSLYDRYAGKRTTTHHLLVVRLGPPDVFPERSHRRYAGVEEREYADWSEALVAVAAHEGMHAQHAHDDAYRSKSGRRKAATFTDAATGRKVPFRRGARVRVGVERIEPKCEAFENYMLTLYRARG